MKPLAKEFLVSTEVWATATAAFCVPMMDYAQDQRDREGTEVRRQELHRGGDHHQAQHDDQGHARSFIGTVLVLTFFGSLVYCMISNGLI